MHKLTPGGFWTWLGGIGGNGTEFAGLRVAAGAAGDGRGARLERTWMGIPQVFGAARNAL